jgi:hypothetical protein
MDGHEIEGRATIEAVLRRRLRRCSPTRPDYLQNFCESNLVTKANENMAERVRLDFRHLAQVVVKTRLSNNSLCLCGVQALFKFCVCCLSRPRMTSIESQKRYHWYHSQPRVPGSLWERGVIEPWEGQGKYLLQLLELAKDNPSIG